MSHLSDTRLSGTRSDSLILKWNVYSNKGTLLRVKSVMRVYNFVMYTEKQPYSPQLYFTFCLDFLLCCNATIIVKILCLCLNLQLRFCIIKPFRKYLQVIDRFFISDRGPILLIENLYCFRLFCLLQIIIVAPHSGIMGRRWKCCGQQWWQTRQKATAAWLMGRGLRPRKGQNLFIIKTVNELMIQLKSLEVHKGIQKIFYRTMLLPLLNGIIWFRISSHKFRNELNPSRSSGLESAGTSTIWY